MDEYPCILYIDDDEENLLGFETSFSKEFDVYVANSMEVAEQILNSKPIKVLMIDYKLPLEDEAAIVLQIQNKYPHIVFILVTAYIDLDSANKTMELEVFYDVVQKPWGYNELKLALRNAVEKYNLEQENRVLENELLQYKEKLNRS